MRTIRALMTLVLPLVSLLAASASVAQHMNAPGNPCVHAGTGSDMTACFMRASAAADKGLNAYYKRLLANLGSEDVKNLQAAQRLWIQFRDANCAAEYALYEGGSAGPTVRAACVEALTRNRAA